MQLGLDNRKTRFNTEISYNIPFPLPTTCNITIYLKIHRSEQGTRLQTTIKSLETLRKDW